MRLVTVVVEPLSGVKPILANADETRADFAITTRSPAAISETLPPATLPCTATTTGARMRTIRTMAVCRSAVHDLIVTGRAEPRDANAARSSPTLINLTRAEMRTERTSSRAPNTDMQRLTSRQKSPSIGLPRSGWLRTTCASPPSTVHSKLVGAIARPIVFLPGSSGFSTSGRPAFLFLTRGGLNGLPRPLPVFRRKLRKPRERTRRCQMMSAVDTDGVAGNVAASIRHQKDHQVAQFIHLSEPAQRNFIRLRRTHASLRKRIELVPGVFGRKRTRRHRLNANAFRPPFDRE